jgi:caspase domain-containing protein
MKIHAKKLFFCVIRTAVVLVLIAVSGRALAAEAYPETIRRFAFIAGSNDGGPSRVELRFAHSDAKAMARVLRQLGGVESPDTVLLLEPDRFDFEAGLARMRTILENSQGSGFRLELVFYFSGHSDEQGLMLGDDLITYKELRKIISELPANVRIAILDSCSSGALTRGKGGSRRAPFLMDASVNVEGYAYLTSASADESAQESDRVGGSFFTHYLVSGLRGAADQNADNKVTLNKAYQYSFNETLARTESTSAGPQHANYDFQLKGSGDLVLTDLRGTTALLVLPSEMSGRVFIRNRKNQLVAEINKSPGAPIAMGIDPGRYEITVESGPEVSTGTVTLAMGRPYSVETTDLKPVSKEATVARGKQPRKEEAATSDSHGDSDELMRRPFMASFAPGLTTDSKVRNKKVVNNAAINFIGWGDYLSGFEGAALGNIRKNDVSGLQGAGIFNFTMGNVHGLQGSGIFNYAGTSLRGFQWAGIANSVHGPAKGFQGAGISNFNSASSKGFQGAGVLNFNRGGAYGFQGAGIVNVNNGESYGFSAAGIGNYADTVTGVQIAGISNAARTELNGMQIGLTNYAKHHSRGVQLGLVNVAKTSDGVPIGLINAIGDGMLALTLWGSDNSMGNFAVKMGSRHFYSILGYGAHPIGDEDERRDSLIAGLGGHFDFEPIWLEIDFLTHSLHKDFSWTNTGADNLFKLRLTVGWRPVDQFSIFAGPTLNMLISDSRETVEVIPSLWSDTRADANFDLNIGFIVGIQIQPKWGQLNSRKASSVEDD